MKEGKCKGFHRKYFVFLKKYGGKTLYAHFHETVETLLYSSKVYGIMFFIKYCQGFSAGMRRADSPETEKSGRKVEEESGMNMVGTSAFREGRKEIADKLLRRHFLVGVGMAFLIAVLEVVLYFL